MSFKDLFKQALRGIWNLLLLVLVLVGLALPAVVVAFWELLQSFAVIPLLVAVGVLFILALVGIVFIGQWVIKAVKHQVAEAALINSRKTRISVKLLPVVMIGVVFLAYNYYFPTWIYSLGVAPKFGPYIAINGGGGIQISWDTRNPETSKVYYGLSKDNLDLEQYGGEFYKDADPNLKSQHHCVLLTGLAANTTYYYRIPGVTSTTHHFRTPPPDNSIQTVSAPIIPSITQMSIW
jgi:hypothetical protein